MRLIKGVMARSRVDALSELCDPLLKGSNAVFIAAIVSDLFLKKQISVTQTNMARMAQIKRKWDLITKT